MNVLKPDISFNGLIKLSTGKVIREGSIDAIIPKTDAGDRHYWSVRTRHMAGGEYGTSSEFAQLSEEEYNDLIPKLDIKG
ncbi:MAG: hypothetical protein A2104_02020 [Candidatus Melainabacteria bacterium GWF2_32_7]|nr:MAG: hypothetical protein A2104_02020 [Candidatus Melainabacteria bacterium GWF2_32_7]